MSVSISIVHIKYLKSINAELILELKSLSTYKIIKNRYHSLTCTLGWVVFGF